MIDMILARKIEEIIERSFQIFQKGFWKLSS